MHESAVHVRMQDIAAEGDVAELCSYRWMLLLGNAHNLCLIVARDGCIVKQEMTGMDRLVFENKVRDLLVDAFRDGTINVGEGIEIKGTSRNITISVNREEIQQISQGGTVVTETVISNARMA